MTVTLQPGITLGATDALRHQRGQTWTDEQVAYLLHLAFLSGIRHQNLCEVAELIEYWRIHPTAKQTYEQRVTARLDAMESRSGPVTYTGGPVDWDTSKPLNGGTQ